MKPISNLVNSIKSIKTGFTTDYLLESSNGYLLIDTGYPKDYDKFVKKLRKKYDLKISDIAFLLLTHHHDDHAGFASKILNNSDALLIAHENTFKYLKMGKIEDTSSPLNKRVKFVFFILNKFHEFTYPPVMPSEKDIILEGEGPYNEILRKIGIEGKIIYNPGHTEDGISVILDNGFIFPGDNTMNS